MRCAAFGRWRCERHTRQPRRRALADRLLRHERVTAVHYPGLESHPQHELATRQMLHPGTVLAFELAGGRPSAATLIDRLEVARCATSLGGPETLVCHPMTTTHAGLTPEERADSGVTDGLVRVSVGLEDPDDVIDDIVRALA